MYNIPLFKLNYGEEEVDAVVETIRSGWISTGPKCQELESLFVEMLNTPYAVGVSNCTDALHLAMILCGIGPDDEVLCPSLTFSASVNCIRYVGATPVFCDIVGPGHLNIDPKEIERKITKKSKAIVVVHMAGFPAKLDEIIQIADCYGLKIIEDACHGPLSEYKGQKLGTIGDVGCFSFFSNKNISSGEGGMLTTKHESFASRARLLRSHGMTTSSYQRAGGHATAYDVIELGYNFRIDDIRSSLAITQLKKLPRDLDIRAHVRRTYLELLEKLDDLIVPFAENSDFTSNYIMPIVLKNSTSSKRNAVRTRLNELGIQTSVHYPAIHLFSTYRYLKAVLPQTEYVTDNEITLPMYAALSDDEICYIVDSLNKVLNE